MHWYINFAKVVTYYSGSGKCQEMPIIMACIWGTVSPHSHQWNRLLWTPSAKEFQQAISRRKAFSLWLHPYGTFYHQRWELQPSFCSSRRVLKLGFAGWNGAPRRTLSTGASDEIRRPHPYPVSWFWFQCNFKIIIWIVLMFWYFNCFVLITCK